MASLKNLQVDAKATQKDITTSGKLGDRNVGVKMNLNASLPEGYSARLTVTDKTASDLAKNLSVNPAGAEIEVNNGDKLRLRYNLEKKSASVKVAGSADVTDRTINYSAEWRQDNNGIDLEASHDIDRNASVTLRYGVHNKEILAKGKYTIDNSSIAPEFNVSNSAWKVTLAHKLTSNDKLEAVVASGGADPQLSYTRNQDGVELRIEAPVRSDIAANASIRVQRTIDL